MSMNITPTMFPDSLLADLPFGEFWPEPAPISTVQPAEQSAGKEVAHVE
jgi:hypothetical protein